MTAPATNVRPYQDLALRSVADAIADGKRSVLVTMPTGTGKTILFSELARRLPRKNYLAVTHTRDLVYQTAEKLRWWTGEPVGIEMADHRELTRPDGERPRIGVASVQTLTAGSRLDLLPPEDFGVLVFDEAHHAVSNTWRAVAEHFDKAILMGVTATADRADGKALGAVFETHCFDYPIRDAIADGYLVPVLVNTVRTTIALDDVKTKRGGDFDDEELSDRFCEPESLLQIAEPVFRERGDRPTVVFCASVEHAQKMAGCLCDLAGDRSYAAALSGENTREERAAKTAALERGDLKVLTNCQLFTEGWDCPPVSLVVMARPTKSRPLYAQMMGRGTRPSPATGKQDMVCLDFVHNSRKHKLVSAIDIFQGDFSDDVAEIATQAALEERDDGDEDLAGLDVLELMSGAFERFTEERAKVLYQLARRDPFAAIGVDVEAYQSAVIDEPPTAKQIELLKRHGIKDAQLEKLSKVTASKVIGQVMARRGQGLCSPKQARMLARNGIDASDVTIDEASALMGFLAKGGWRPLPKTFSLERWREERRRAFE